MMQMVDLIDLLPYQNTRGFMILANAATSLMVSSPLNAAPLAPKPGVLADNPQLRNQIEDTRQCFYREWPISVSLRHRSEEVLGLAHSESADLKEQPAKIVLEYLESLTKVENCLSPLNKAERDFGITANDHESTLELRSFILSNLEGQRPYTLRIVTVLLRKLAS